MAIKIVKKKKKTLICRRKLYWSISYNRSGNFDGNYTASVSLATQKL